MKRRDLQPLPTAANDLRDVAEIARFLAERFLAGRPALLLRYGDTGGRIMARPPIGSPEYGYLRKFLGKSVTPDQVEWIAKRIEHSVGEADVIGLRSDLLGPEMIPDDFFTAPRETLRQRLCALYPIRAIEQSKLDPDGALRLGQTRRAMETMPLPDKALLTDAWIHVSLAENGFLSALMRHAPSIGIITSATARNREVMRRIHCALGERIRLYECPAYPTEERSWGGDHAWMWSRWKSLVSGISPAFPGEPLLISAGIWTKVIGPAWARAGGIAIDAGSVMDYFAGNASRPAVLATRFGVPDHVPQILSLDNQLARRELIEDFL